MAPIRGTLLEHLAGASGNEAMSNSGEIAERSAPWSRGVELSFGDTVSGVNGIGGAGCCKYCFV